MRILQLCPRVPFPPTDGGAIAMYDVAAGLVQAGHHVTVLALNTPKHHQPAHALAHLGPRLRLLTVEVDTRLSPVAALRNLLLSDLPYIVERFVTPAMQAQLQALLTQEAFDVVQLEGTFASWYVDTVRAAAPRVPVVLRAHNLEHTIWEMLASRTRNPAKRWYLRQLAGRLRRFEQAIYQRFSAIAAITEADRQRLQALGARGQLAFIPAGVDLARFQPPAQPAPRPRTVFMLGSLDWLPNQEGIDWLLREVWPVVQARCPGLELHLAGKNAPDHLLNCQAPGLTVHGFVESAAAFMQAYELMLVPLLSGGGMRIKIIEGMAVGKAILSTQLGAEGIAVESGHDILLADDPAAWIALLEDYYHGRLPVAALGAEAARTAATLYDNRRVVARFEALYQGLAHPAAHAW